MQNRMQQHQPAMPEANLLLKASQLYALYIKFKRIRKEGEEVRDLWYRA